MSIARHFAEAEDYDRHAGIQREVAQGLAARIAWLSLPAAPEVLEIGCGTGFLGEALLARLPAARLTASDIAPAMLERARARLGERPGLIYARIDGEAVPGDRRYDLICSSLAFQWFGDLAGAVARLRGRLRPGGALAFTTLAAGSFAAWRAAHETGRAGIRDYPAREALAAMGLEVEITAITRNMASGAEFLRHLAGIGARVPREGHRPLAAGEMRRVMRRFEAAGAVADYVVATCILQG